MKMSKWITLLLMTLAYINVYSQVDKEVIIIEKSYDQDGNEIGRTTKRLKGVYTEEQIQEMIDGGDMPGPSIRSYDLDGMGYEDEMRSFFGGGRDAQPTIGLSLSFDDHRAKVESVRPGSGAQSADIRVGDELVMINSIPISTMADIQDVLAQRSIGDRVQIKIFRDGTELEKEVELKAGYQRFSFETPEGGAFDFSQFFGDSGMDFTGDMDSILSRMLGPDFMKRLELDTPFGMNLSEGLNNEVSAKPTLGVFLDEGLGGTVISEVIPGSAASKAELKVGDKILRMDDNVVGSFREINAQMNRKRVGDTLDLQIDRKGNILNVTVSL